MIILHFYIEFLTQSFWIVRNMQNSIETRGNLCTELGPPVFRVNQNTKICCRHFIKKKPEELVKEGADQMGSWLKPLEVSVFM